MAENHSIGTEATPPSEHGGGFPPFQQDTFASQLVWLAIFFIALYLTASKLALPRVGSIIADRRKRISDDLAEAARMKDAAVLRHRAKVQLIPDEELERLMPQREATVEIVLNNGTRLTEHVSAVRGTFDNPMTRDEVIAKARDLITPVLGAATSSKLIDSVFALENVKNVRDLRPLLQRA